MLTSRLFDVQVNGFGGVDFQQPNLSAAALRHAVDTISSHQTRRFFLTLITDAIPSSAKRSADIISKGPGFRPSRVVMERRTRVASLFPNEASLLRLISALLCEISEERLTVKIYLNMKPTDLPQH